MRVTNSMVHNMSLVNIGRNMRNLERLYEQANTTQQISRPSQDPLIATRSLRFRTRLSEVEQFQRNVESGHAWMNVTEAAFFNLHEILVSMKERINEAASDHTNMDNKLDLIKDIENLKRQVSMEMNQTHLGRYVFAGWRTDQPPVLNTARLGMSYQIRQVFNAADIETTRSIQRLPIGLNPEDSSGMPIVRDPVNIMKLPYRTTPGVNGTGVTFGTPNADGLITPVPGVPGFPATGGTVGAGTLQDGLGIFRPDGTPFTIRVIDFDALDLTRDPATGLANNPADVQTFLDAYRPPDDGQTIHFIPTTGELVFGDRISGAFDDGVQVVYEVSNLQQGDLNPLVYFDTIALLERFTDLDRFPDQSSVAEALAGIDGMVLPGGIFTPTPPIRDRGTLEFDPPYVITQNVVLPAEGNVWRMTYGNIDGGTENFTFILPPPPTTVVAPVVAPVVDPATGVVTFTPAEAAALRAFVAAGGTVQVTYDKTEFAVNDLIPTSNPNVVSALGPHFVGEFPRMDTPIMYEFSNGSSVQVNSLAVNTLTDKMFADMRRLVEFAQGITVSSRQEIIEFFRDNPDPNFQNLHGDDLERAIEERIADEQAYARGALHSRLNNMLELIDQHATQITAQHTHLGNRMNRVEMFEIRLEDQEGDYTRLKSENEAADMTRVLIFKARAEAAFTAALQAFAQINDLSLVHFI